MAYHRFVTIDGQRHDIADLEITGERSCDRCGRYMTHWTAVAVSASALDDGDTDVPVDLCAQCVRDHFHGLADLATKVMGRV